MIEAGMTVDTYCPGCDTKVAASIVERPDSLAVRGDEIRYLAHVAICPLCGEVIADSRVEAGNLDRAYAEYRKSRRIPSADEIRAVRSSYGLSLREFSRFLGFGEQTVARYESGALPSEASCSVLRLAQTKSGARQLLDMHRSFLSRRSVELVEKYLERSDERGLSTCRSFPRPNWPPEGWDVPSPVNGFRGIDYERVRALVIHLAASCPSLFKTKLQKAMYFCDALAFETFSRSLTGLRYAHANYGPVMDGKDAILGILAQCGDIEMMESSSGWGEVVVPRSEEGGVFSLEELEVIDRVATFVNTFGTAGELSAYSHRLSSWADTKNGEVIDFTASVGEVGRAIEARLARWKEPEKEKASGLGSPNA